MLFQEMMGMLFSVEAENLSQFAFWKFHRFLARAAYDWKCETCVHQAWLMLAMWQVV